MYKPPECPECKNPLFQVREIEVEVYEFDEKYGYYSESREINYRKRKCPYCGAELNGVFPKGLTNHYYGGEETND